MASIITVTVGETIGNEEAVFIDSGGLALKATLPDRPAVGFCLVGASSGLIQVFLSGFVQLPFVALAGTLVYLSNTSAGAVTGTQPDGLFQSIGTILEDKMLVKIEQPKHSVNPIAAAFFK